MLKSIREWDENLFIFLNGFHSDRLDAIVFQFTQTITWIPLYLFLSFIIIKNFRNSWWWILAAIGLTVLFADQATSTFFKPYFARLRPCHDVRWEGLIYNYGICGGMYGFASSHAANSFAVATIINLTCSHRIRYLSWLFLWAALFSYTRIYLGVHYPTDVVVGALVGVISAWVALKIVEGFQRKFFETQSLNQ
jgi:undecaprenyl-diphosphatase